MNAAVAIKASKNELGRRGQRLGIVPLPLPPSLSQKILQRTVRHYFSHSHFRLQNTALSRVRAGCLLDQFHRSSHFFKISKMLLQDHLNVEQVRSFSIHLIVTCEQELRHLVIFRVSAICNVWSGDRMMRRFWRENQSASSSSRLVATAQRLCGVPVSELPAGGRHISQKQSQRYPRKVEATWS